MNEFFDIRKGTKMDAVYISPKHGYPDQKDISRILRADTPLVRENVFTKEMGETFYDTIDFTDAGNFAISERVKLLLEENHITGWSCFPIKIDHFPDKTYYGFQLTSKSAGKILNLEQLDNYEEDFIKFDVSTWDGSDLFTLENTTVLACTSRVKELFEKEKVSNVEFENIIPLSFS